MAHVIRAASALLLVLLSVRGVASAADCADWVGTVVSIQGTMTVQRIADAQRRWTPLATGERLCPNDAVHVQDRSRGALRLRNDAVLRLDQNTTITLTVEKEQDQDQTWIKFVGDLARDIVPRGIVHFLSRVPRGLKVVTPFVNGTVEGTEFVFQVRPDGAVLSVLSGRVAAERVADDRPVGPRQIVESGQSVIAERGQELRMLPVVPSDAVQWALYYPSILDARAAQSTDTSDRIAYAAMRALSIGRLELARTEIGKLDQSDGRRLAVESVIAVVQGDKAAALESARKAVDALPKSASALIALSYAQQASFDLEGARASLEKAVSDNVEPQNALAHARLAEILLSLGKVPDAVREANRAVELDPGLARTQTVLGFAHLADLRTKQAQEDFTKAMTLDPADPLPRLGLGLTRIRQGHLEEGRQEIETAASLDPANSLVRSYLGKAYYEERRSKPASAEFQRAKELDPNDPTPWFYDAIEKQTTNRPVEALQDLQRAIELNDNRAVYRSRLLLDEDLAARSSALARVYSDLGFQQLALVEGWKSANTDPTSFSAHRFLADSYSLLPRHEIARVSELLQSQLLQPLNITPVQPRLAEPNLFLISAQGPAAVGFNEFNPLFTRDRITFQTSGLAAEHGTYAGEGVLSGIYDRASFSLGGYHFHTDGWRSNANQTDSIANAFVQLALTRQTSVQAEFRYRKTEEGDLQLNFFPGDFRRQFKQEVETTSYRLGARHAFTPDSIVLGSFIYQHRDSGQLDKPDPIFVGLSDRFPGQEAFSGELQYLFRSRPVNLVAGAGHASVDKSHEVKLDFDFSAFGGEPVTVRTVTEEDDRHTNAYLYTYLNVIPNVTFTLGVSGDFFNTESRDTASRHQVNPKFGVTWNPLPDTTLRAAVFRVLKRTLITDQTLEPTQVAGFNQFFDDINSTDSWRYGVGVDQKLWRSVFVGGELSARRLSIPFRSTVVDEFGEVVEDRVRRGDGREYGGRAYLFWTPHRWLALSAEYQYERFDNDDAVAFFFKELTTHRVPVGLRFFHPSGLGLLLRGTYVNQHGEFVRRGSTSFEPGRDDFFLVDAAINYRLPKRYGIASIGATNLFDQKFRYQETDLRNASILPNRTFFARITLELP